jgi:hypothetical protein
MAALLVQSIRLPPVKAPFRIPVSGNLLVAIKAKSGLRLARRGFVTITAIALKLAMSFDKRAWKNQLLEQRLRPSRLRKCDTANHDE